MTVRLLDPPLHEFLPDTGELAIKEATVGLDAEEQTLFEAAKQWHEFNPMLGTRGVRLGVIKPGLYSMQVRALMEAAVQRVADGGKPVIEIMIPLTVTREELALARSWVEEAVAATLAGVGALDAAPAGGPHRHDDRDARAPRCAPARSPRWPTSSRSGPTTSRR